MTAIVRTILLLALALSLQACASITTGAEQTVTVNTSPVQEAACALRNEKGKWEIAHTPGSAKVAKANSALFIQCKTESGYNGSLTVSSAMASAALGNLIVGGVVGAAIDIGSGAAYQYPSFVFVPLTGGPAAPTGPASTPGGAATAAIPPPVPPSSQAQKTPQTTTTANSAPVEPNASGACYLPDGQKAMLGREECAARMGLVGA